MKSFDATLVLNHAAQAFQRESGVSTTTAPPVSGESEGHIHLWREGETWDLHVAVKPWLNPQHMELLRLTKWKERTVLVSHYVNPPQGEVLRSLNIPYIDTAGNCFLNLPGLHILITGKKREERQGAERNWDFYRPAELRVLFALLCVDGLAERTHEEIRQKTGVAIGTINGLLKSLAQEEFLISPGGKTRRLARKRELIERWAAAYPHGLRQKLHLGRFAAPPRPLWENIDPSQYGIRWGGEVAAMSLTPDIKPRLITIYANQLPNEMITDQGLHHDPHGEVEILRHFWEFEGEEKSNAVPPLLVYADLLATHEERNIVAAREIYDRYLA